LHSAEYWKILKVTHLVLKESSLICSRSSREFY